MDNRRLNFLHWCCIDIPLSRNHQRLGESFLVKYRHNHKNTFIVSCSGKLNNLLIYQSLKTSFKFITLIWVRCIHHTLVMYLFYQFCFHQFNIDYCQWSFQIERILYQAFIIKNFYCIETWTTCLSKGFLPIFETSTKDSIFWSINSWT